MKILYPLRLKPYTKSVIWGSDVLANKYNKPTESYNIGESWELSCRENEKSFIMNGEFGGKSLNDYISICGNGVIGKNYKGERFPILVKLLSSSAPLSVQVHPDDAYALEKENELGKTEMWYIIDTEKDSELVMGLKNYNKVAIQKASENGNLGDLFNIVDVMPGESYFIPAGLVHAMGQGILLYEVQQNSDVTYRVYDYDRIDKNGNKRELHTKKALEVIRDYKNSEIKELSVSKHLENKVSQNATTLVSCDKFSVEKLILSEKDELTCTEDSFLSLTCVKGEFEIEHNNIRYPALLGETYFIPAGLGKFKIFGEAEILCASIK